MYTMDIAVVTPSYAPDFERCQLLNWSVNQFIAPPTKHYILVPRKDFSLFRSLQGPRTEIIVVESILPWWLIKPPFVKNGWFSFKTPPIRNWILQQIVKLSVGQCLQEEIIVFADSDAAFIRPFDLQNFVQGDRVRLFRVGNLTEEQIAYAADWNQSAEKLLGLPAKTIGKNYISGLLTWKRSNVLKLYEHLERVSGRGWVETICYAWHLSEYVLYGSFVEYVLQEQMGHFYDDRPLCREYWAADDMSNQSLEQFFQSVTPDQIAVMISSKAHIKPDRYRVIIESFAAAEPAVKIER
jgi:hypothetical protein